MTDSSPLTEGLLMIHKIITRGLKNSIMKCDLYTGTHGMPADETAGLHRYVSALKWVTHAHHLSEDEIVFPYLRYKIMAPYDRLKEDHKSMARILELLDQSLLEMSSGRLIKLREALKEFEELWIPHIKTEEEYFIPEMLQSVMGMEEQIFLAKKLADHGRKNSGPVPLTVPFMFYNLEGKDREDFMIPFPWIAKKILVPIFWRAQWKPMSPYLLLQSK
jgi:hemerythrin-like domain-containing protein